MPLEAVSRTESRAEAIRLEDIGGFILDIDGTIAAFDPRTRRFGPLPGAIDFVNRLKELEIPYLFFTNGTLHCIANYVDRMNGIGLTIDTERMLTPSTVAADLFKRNRLRRVLVLGEEGAQQPLRDANLEVVLPTAKEWEISSVDAVYIAWHPFFGYEDLSAACKAVWAGAKLYVSSRAKQFATAGGPPALVISSSIAAAVTNATGKTATLVGKPSAIAYRYAARMLDSSPSTIAVVGDDAKLEPAFAAAGGGLCIGVETGLASADDFRALSDVVRPEIIVRNLVELQERLDR